MTFRQNLEANSDSPGMLRFPLAPAAGWDESLVPSHLVPSLSGSRPCGWGLQPVGFSPAAQLQDPDEEVSGPAGWRGGASGHSDLMPSGLLLPYRQVRNASTLQASRDPLRPYMRTSPLSTLFGLTKAKYKALTVED